MDIRKQGKCKLADYVELFNENDEELYSNIPNEKATEFLEDNIPYFHCPDKNIESTYYFRWWTYRKHVKQTPGGYVITEFLPDVPWSGKYNTISCPAAHHYYEGRWLHNPQYLNDYSDFWLGKGGDPRLYSFWIANALHARNLVQPDDHSLIRHLPKLVKNYEAWENSWQQGEHRIGRWKNGLYWTTDDRDGGEVSIGGHGFRPTLNSFMYGDAIALADIANLAGDAELSELYQNKALELKQLIQDKLWDSEANFFKILSSEGKLSSVKELYGYTPWYFNLPDSGYEQGWQELMNPEGFKAPFGPTFAEQRHPEFVISYEGHECQWNGPSWPLATCSVLTALANLLNNYKQKVIDKQAYFDTLQCYTKSHRVVREDGVEVPWIDENLNPYSGDWISRTRLEKWKDGTWCTEKGGYERGKDYNHSTYNDLIITGLVGLRPRADNVIEVNPLLPEASWDHFCLDNVLYHGKNLCVIWDISGTVYNMGQGLLIFANGVLLAQSEKLGRLKASL